MFALKYSAPCFFSPYPRPPEWSSSRLGRGGRLGWDGFMPSLSYQEWITNRTTALNEIENAHAAVGGTARGRRYATQQINQAYAVLLASQFQGFCRDLHSESVDYLLSAISPSPALSPVLQAEMTRGRQLDRGNAQPASVGADFGRLGIGFWSAVDRHDPRNATRRVHLGLLNAWRNAIAHQDFDPTQLGGTTTLRLDRVRRWRGSCQRLALSFDAVMRNHLHALTGTSPW